VREYSKRLLSMGRATSFRAVDEAPPAQGHEVLEESSEVRQIDRAEAARSSSQQIRPLDPLTTSQTDGTLRLRIRGDCLATDKAGGRSGAIPLRGHKGGNLRKETKIGIAAAFACGLLLAVPTLSVAGDFETTVDVVNVTQDPTTGRVEFDIAPVDGGDAWRNSKDGRCSGTGYFEDDQQVDIESGTGNGEFQFTPTLYGGTVPRILRISVDCSWSEKRVTHAVVKKTGWSWHTAKRGFSVRGPATAVAGSTYLFVDSESYLPSSVCWRVWHPGYSVTVRYYYSRLFSSGRHRATLHDVSAHVTRVCSVLGPYAHVAIRSVGVKWEDYRKERRVVTTDYYGSGEWTG
jgi:hypothetical protein